MVRTELQPAGPVKEAPKEAAKPLLTEAQLAQAQEKLAQVREAAKTDKTDKTDKKDDAVEDVIVFKPHYATQEISNDLCVVLHGYGRVSLKEEHYVDGYKFVGGVGRNIPRAQAEAWAKGVRLDGKPAISRVYLQAILKQGLENETVEFAKATGIQPLEPSALAAMISATDAAQLAQALGRQGAVKLAEQLLERAAAR